MSDKIKLKQYQVYMEPALWDLMRRLSLINGCGSHPECGSASEAVRRFAKSAALRQSKNLINIKNIDWGEIYT